MTSESDVPAGPDAPRGSNPVTAPRVQIMSVVARAKRLLQKAFRKKRTQHRMYAVPVGQFYRRGGDTSPEAFERWVTEIQKDIERKCAAEGPHVKATIILDEADLFDHTTGGQKCLADLLATGRRSPDPFTR